MRDGDTRNEPDDHPGGLEPRLAEAEELYRATFEQDAVGIAHAATDGRFLRVNRRLCEFLGYSNDELLRLRMAEITHSEDLERSTTGLGQLLTGERSRLAFEKRYLHKSGAELWGHVTVTLQRGDDHQPHFFVAVVEDITHHRQLEATLRETQSHLARQLAELDHLYDHSPLGLCLISPELRFLRVNRALATMNGPPVSAHIGKKLSEVVPAIAARTESIYRRVMDTGEPAIEIEIHGATPAEPETDRDWLVSYYPVRTEGGSLLGVGTVVMEITDRKRAERAAVEAQRSLADRERHEKERIESELNRVRDELVRKSHLAAIGQLSSSIAHELRNPLGSVRNAVFVLRRGKQGPDYEERLQRYLGIIEEEVARADRVITSHLAATGRHGTKKQRVDLAEIIHRAIDATPGANGLRLRLELEDDPFILLVDPTQFLQVIQNLLANSVEATSGNGDFAITATHGRHEDTITFSDTGPGIDPRVRDRLFEPLVTTQARGTGLGLTICRQMIELHNGRIETIESPEAGARFRITLPSASPTGSE